MNEKQYKTMSSAGVSGIVVGVIVITVGIAAGIVSIVSGARLLAAKKKVIF